MSFFAELKRRNVVRVGLAYVVIGWVLAQVAEFAVDTFGAPDWVLKIFVVFLALGFLLALFFAWAFEMTPDGIKREKDVDRSQSITPTTGRKLNFIIIGVLVLAVTILLIDEFIFDRPFEGVAAEPEPVSVQTSVSAPDVTPSIAVLPFVNMSDDKDYFADGLSEELLNLLARIPDLKVAGRTSSFAFKGRQEDLREIGDALGVATVLEGSVRRSGDRLRITAQLINVEDGFHIWSETYDRQMADIFDIQDDVAKSITDALQIRLVRDSSRPTQNTEAYALYLEALPYVAANDRLDTLAIVNDLLDSAIELDPAFAKAHELMAVTYWAVSGDAIEPQAAQVRIKESVATALQLDPSLHVARLIGVSANGDGWNWSREIEAAEAANVAHPRDYNVLRVLCLGYSNTGYFRESIECADEMVELEPLSSLSFNRRATAQLSSGLAEEARNSWRRANELGGDVYAWDVGFTHLVVGEYDEALDAMENVDASYFGWQPEDLRVVREGAVGAEDSKAFLDGWIEEKLAGVDSFVDINGVNYWYLALGYMDEYWHAILTNGGDRFFHWSNVDYPLQYGMIYGRHGFTSHPKFMKYAEVSGMTDLWDRRGPPDFCSKDSGEWVCE